MDGGIFLFRLLGDADALSDRAAFHQAPDAAIRIKSEERAED